MRANKFKKVKCSIGCALCPPFEKSSVYTMKPPFFIIALVIVVGICAAGQNAHDVTYVTSNYGCKLVSVLPNTTCLPGVAFNSLSKKKYNYSSIKGISGTCIN